MSMKMEEARRAKKRFDSKGEQEALQGALDLLELRLRDKRGPELGWIKLCKQNLDNRQALKK